MIIIRATDDEVDVSGSSYELQQVRAAIRRFAACSDPVRNIPADATADPTPYQFALRELRLLRTGERTRVSISNQMSLVVSGPAENLRKFSSWFAFSPDAPAGSHNHFERLPGDPYVAEDAVPLLISVEAQQSVQPDRREDAAPG